MKRILFIDDEPRLLEGLQTLLRRHRREWDMCFTLSADSALKALAASDFDVVVSDMRMPGMDGAALLGRVQSEHPQAVRIMLSGHTEFEGVLRAVPVAHQFLHKPCDATTFQEVLKRVCSLDTLVQDKAMQRAIGHIDMLPVSSQVYAELLGVLSEPHTTAAEVQHIVVQDIALCAKLLQLVNSSFFGLARRITPIEDAVVHMGFHAIKSLVLSLKSFQKASRYNQFPPGTPLGDLQRHALLTATIAEQLLTDKKQKEDAFTAALLHDIGILILIAAFPDYANKLHLALRENTKPLHEIEHELAGATHAEIGAYLLGLWGLPYPIIEAVAHHHYPARASAPSLNVVAAVHIADVLAHEQQVQALAVRGVRGQPTLDMAYLEALGVTHQLPSWRVMARSLDHTLCTV